MSSNRRTLLGSLLLPALLRAVPSVAQAPASLPDAEAILERAAEIPRLHALIVIRDGGTWIERRLRGPGLERPVNIKSAAKSVLSALAGIAIDKGILESRPAGRGGAGRAGAGGR